MSRQSGLFVRRAHDTCQLIQPQQFGTPVAIGRAREGFTFKLQPNRRSHIMQMNDLQDLMVDNLKDLYSAENQMLKALPKVAKKVENEQLRQALEQHVVETQAQVGRLEKIFDKLGE